jgi:hypothetical protein
MCWTKTLWPGCKDGIKLECLVKKQFLLTSSLFDILVVLECFNILFPFDLRSVVNMIAYFIYSPMF